MAKLISVVVLSALLVIMATASSAYRTIITTVEVDEPNPARRGDCRREIRGQDLRSCMSYIGPRRSTNEEEEAEEKQKQQEEQQQLQRCRNQLSNMRNQCQCEAIRTMFQLARKDAQRHEWPGVVARGTQLPSECGVRDCDVPFTYV